MSGNNSMVPPASLCCATARADASCECAERESPNTSYEANRYEFVPKLRKRFPFRGSADAAARNCKVNSCGTMRQLMERLHSKGVINRPIASKRRAIRTENIMRLRSEVLHRRSPRGNGWRENRKRKHGPKAHRQRTKTYSAATEALSLSSAAPAGSATDCNAIRAQPHGNGWSDYMLFRQHDTQSIVLLGAGTA